MDLLGVRVTGPLAWWIYRATYLLKLVGANNKVRVLTTLALNRLFERDISADGAATAFLGSDPRGRARAGC